MNIDWDNVLKQIRFALARPLHPRGVIWVGVPLLLTILALILGWHTANFWLLLTVVFYICFRDPVRVPPTATNIATAPIDGVFMQLDRAPWPMEAAQIGEAQCITINPRFYDVHVVRAPLAGALAFAQQYSGQWGSPVFEKSAGGNERTVFVLRLAGDRMMALEIIGGALPDRVKLLAHTGDIVTLGQPVAYADFGGEVRLYVPDGMTITAKVGQRMVAGETVMVAVDQQ